MVAAGDDEELSGKPEPALPNGGDVVHFDDVQISEFGAINARREALSLKFPGFVYRNLTRSIDGKRRTLDATGLALSGGGIRSAAVCLGVLQALDAALRPSNGIPAQQNAPTLLDRIDYLSTVSGGGYIGSSLSAGLSKRSGKFPFRSFLGREETPSIQHIRDHSNYLFANGFVDVIDSIAIYLRGLLANFVIILSPILLAVVFTLYCSPDRTSLGQPRLYNEIVSQFFPAGIITSVFTFDRFGFSKLVFLFLLVVFLLWSLKSVAERFSEFPIWVESAKVVRGLVFRARRVLRWIGAKARHVFKGPEPNEGLWQALFGQLQDGDLAPKDYSEASSRWARVGGTMLLILLFCLFFESQPLVLQHLFDYAAVQKAEQQPIAEVGFYIQTLTAVLAALASIVGAFADKLEKLMSKFSIGGWMAKTGHYTIKISIIAASAAVPLALWSLYILLSYWGIKSALFCGDRTLDQCAKPYAAPDWLYNFADWMFYGSSSLLFELKTNALAVLPNWVVIPAKFVIGVFSPLLTDIIWIVTAFFGFMFSLLLKFAMLVVDVTGGDLMAGIYTWAAVVLMILSLLPALNGNSLHRLYRDRLSTAFVFYERLPEGARSAMTRFFSFIQRSLGAPRKSEVAGAKGGRPDAEDDPIVSLDQFKLTQISARYAPYHIINTALNIQGSKYANQRGRNAEFFMFSRNYVGSEATGYVATSQMESVATDLNLATAMAVSGAAASANMGSNSIKWLTPTLALLNVRLGYWLRNPIAAIGIGWRRIVAGLAEMANIYFFKEMWWRLNEKSYNVYLTDGGHIENLGLYELIKRRCRLIVAVDAEADPNMHFGAFVTLQRYARIDLGTRIELPWQDIRARTLETTRLNAEGSAAIPDPERCGPHTAIGIIKYPDGETGYLFYIKSSMSGDENDYIIDYQRRHPSFPHETTGDQFFSEEQFEAYRALGFHMAHRALTGGDDISTFVAESTPSRRLRWNSPPDAKNPIVKMRALLGVEGTEA